MIQDLKLLYDQWNNKKLILEDFSDFIEITTPFVDMHHDYIQLFFTHQKNGTYMISDDGHIVNELEMLGVNVNNAKKRKEFFNTTLKIFGVAFNSETNELCVSFDSLDDYPKKQNNLLQCILRVSDMLLTARNTVASIFTEDVATFFEDNNVFYTPDPGFIGKSGNQQNFDFALPRTKKKNEKLIRAINTPSADNYTPPLFSFIDVRDARPDSDFFVLANDGNIPIADKFLSSLNNYDVEVLAWSKRFDWVDKLRVI
ncbi:DUF1829 domain-containing protein [Sporosarcina sp. G11-34]|uniref:DUF1829 domain-containing protein n=1 Tax=Sporosarcina sp. G11-34 TaxID=2849605 RepID=UPI0022A98BE7|nr:DUF1829 domain-containing protein [Sporosarcina sp. G11-34]MCZ2260632.1 DUF1829 domain-containing protein [Sporosarcina sp. G11-34]